MGALQTSIDFIHTLYTLGERIHIVWLDLREWFPSEGVEVEYDCIEYVSHTLFNPLYSADMILHTAMNRIKHQQSSL